MTDKRRQLYLWMIFGGGAFLILAGLALTILNQSPAGKQTATPASVDEVKRISVAEAKAAFDSGTAVFVDVRDSMSYDQSHIPGALLIPINDLTNHLSALDRSSWIITYCT